MKTVFLVEFHFAKTPVFHRHVVVNAHPVNRILAVHENDPSDNFNFFMDQKVAELIVGFVHEINYERRIFQKAIGRHA